MKYTTIVHHEKYPPSLGCQWTITANSKEEAEAKADKIVTHLQHGVKPKKRQGPLVHTELILVEK